MFVGLVVVHEFGHFLAARRKGVIVEEFGIGFPPTAWSKKLKSGMLFTLNWLPLGGFVRLKGENDSAKTKGSFGAARTKTKIQIMMAGVGMNLLTAFAIFTFLALIGMPTIIPNQFALNRDVKIVREVDHKGEVKIAAVSKGQPADKVGLQKDDILVSLAGNKITEPDIVRDIAAAHAGQSVTIEFMHGDQFVSKTVILSNNYDGKGYLGVSPTTNETGVQIRRFTWSAPIVSLGLMKQITFATLKGLGSAVHGLGSMTAGLVTGNHDARQSGQELATSQVSGPLGIFVLIREGAKLGLLFILMIMGVISLALAIMNALPIPALDGGRLFVMLLYRSVLRKPLTEDTENRIHGTGFAVLMLLFVLITIVDIGRFR